MYLWLAAGIAFAAVGAWGTYERWQAQRYETMYAAEVERVKALGVQISTQNAAVEALKSDQDKKVAKAEAGLKAVQDRVRALSAEATRLGAQAAAAKATARPGGCTPSGADRAVEAIRKGL